MDRPTVRKTTGIDSGRRIKCDEAVGHQHGSRVDRDSILSQTAAERGPAPPIDELIRHERGEDCPACSPQNEGRRPEAGRREYDTRARRPLETDQIERKTDADQPQRAHQQVPVRQSGSVRPDLPHRHRQRDRNADDEQEEQKDEVGRRASMPLGDPNRPGC